MSISFDLPDELRDMQDVVLRFARDQVRSHLRDYEEQGGLPDDLCRELHGMGLTTLPLPPDQGGPGLDLRAACVLLEELAWGDVGVAVAAPGAGGAGAAVALFGRPEQHERLLKPFAADDAFAKRGALALVEGPFGLGPDAVSTTAERASDGWVLRGEKRYVLNGDKADLTVVLAREQSGPEGWAGLSFFAIEGRPQGYSTSERQRTLGLNTASYATIRLDGVKVPVGNRLAGSGDPSKDVRLVVARQRVLDAARLVGCLRAASEYAFKYSTERRAFGKLLYEHQALTFMMADMATRVDAVRWLVWRAAWRLDAEGASEAAFNEATLACRHASELAVLVTTDAVQILGGHGYIQDHPVEKWMRDARCLGLVDGLAVDDETALADAVVEARS